MSTPAPARAAVPLEVLTDEEIEVLQASSNLVVQPHLATLPEAECAPALRTAYRGLLARGIVDPPTPDALATSAGKPTVELQVREDVLSIVTLRRAASAVVCAARTTVTGQDFWYAHVVEHVVLIEQVSTDGLHRFALASADTLGDLLLDATVHPDTTDGTGPEVTVPDATDPPLEVIERLGTAILRTDIVVRTSDDQPPALTGLFTGPAGAWLLSTRLGDLKPVTIRPVTQATLTTHVHALATTAITAGATLPTTGAK